MKLKSNFLFSLAISASLWACQTQKLSGDLTMSLPLSYRSEQAVNVDSSIGSIPWQDFFQDTLLQRLIDTALQQNVDMQLALNNIESASLLLRQAKAGQLPDVQLQVQANTTNPSNNSLNGLSLGQFLGQNHIEDYSAAVGLSWEADIWGKIKSRKAQALAAYLQTEEARKAIQTQLVSQIAKGYYQLLMLYELEQIAEQNLRLSDSTLQLVRLQYEVGDISSLAVEQLSAQRLAAASLIPDFQQQILLQENALRMLTGEFPKAIRIKGKLSDIAIPATLGAGIPAELLSKRPDVKRAELSVTAAQAYRHVARAQMYPSLTISAQAGVNAFKASNWFNIPASVFGALTGGITQPLLQKRALKTQYEIAKIDYENSVIQFRQAVINAVGEVSNALVSIQKLKEREKLVFDKASRLKNAVQQAALLYETGTASYLDVITAQSNALQSELELVQIQQAELASVVDLYRSLGGGWSAE
ncbi:NodT family efflux transporter outer membrane factor (OMF) lipoprotein [Sphingobacterium allocomposti]|uniref:NodT family efflux transporter outer membrane factor (OMF) lipoprotein n=1 Tax=Sphingobacterium allocomposti TaxID=415956 RepID=A0A5S5D4V3_9SPHI|nr:efflux transporter outer membrane subunit [Sphingobacterium composti Yoo et al. 2007 non Ten et al. 2007]TYP91063.1 NodT family efflux transporter outer membrane factor (OMF) lipoprotein [Sphingobacterium composti Yoo et al. 2007 non Ten et al. 2007]